MRVLQINAVYGEGSTGTIVRDIEYLCEQSGIECYVASPDVKVREAKRGYVIGNFFDHKLHALLSRIHGKQAYFSHLPTWNLLHWMSEIKPDIVHLHNLHSNYINLNILLDFLVKKNIRTIITLHDCWFYTGGCFHYSADGCNGWLNKCGVCPKGKSDPQTIFSKHTAQVLEDRKKFLHAISNIVITGVSKWISNEAKKTFLYDKKVVTIHNGVDLTVFKPTQSNFRKELNIEGKYVILGPASKWLLPVNKDVLEQFTQLMQQDEILLLFGVTKCDIKLPPNVITYGYTKNRSELAALYSMADVFANTTREDSFSLINIESQACGTPVVTFNATGPNETVDDINSLKAKVGDAADLYNKIQIIRKQSSKATTNACIQFVTEHFEINDNYNKYIKLYNNFYEADYSYW